MCRKAEVVRVCAFKSVRVQERARLLGRVGVCMCVQVVLYSCLVERKVQAAAVTLAAEVVRVWVQSQEADEAVQLCDSILQQPAWQHEERVRGVKFCTLTLSGGYSMPRSHF